MVEPLLKEYEAVDRGNTVVNQVKAKSINTVTSEAFYCEHSRYKVPVKLEWEPQPGVTNYDVVIHRLYTNKKTLFKIGKHKKHIMISPNARYKWKVLALDNNGKVIMSSDFKNLYVKSRQSIKLSSVFEDNFPQFQGNYKKIDHTYELNLNYVTSQPIEQQINEKVNNEMAPSKGILPARIPASVTANDYTLWSPFWFNLGIGLNLAIYEQEITDTASLAYDALKSPNVRGELGIFVTDKIGVIASGFQSPGNLIDENVGLNEDYTWTSYLLEGTYLFGKGKVNKNLKSNWYLRYGLHQHKIPLLEAFPTSSGVTVLENTLVNFGLGIGNRTKFSKDLRTDFFIRYQHPISSKADKNTYSLDSGMLVDFYIAANYQLHGSFHMGAFLNSKFLNLEYGLANGFESVSGTQSLFNNIFGLYLGFEL